jgi:putative ABC transport system substrate-binding protein
MAFVRRRRFVASLAAVAVANVAARQGAKRPRIVVLHPASVEGSTAYQHLVPRLAQLGYVDGKTMTVDVRSGNGVTSALPKLVTDAIASRPDVLIVVGPAAVRVAAAATKVIPIVAIDLESDPVAAGWMRTLARPDSNVTGLFLDLTGMSIKWLQLLREAAPGVRDVAFLWDASTGQAQLAATSDAAAKLGLAARTIAIDDWTRFEGVMTSAMKPRPGALIVLSSPVAFQFSAQLAQFTKAHRVPAISPFRPFAEAGGLMSYGPDLDLFFMRAPIMVDRILRGASPADIAVEQPVRYELVINDVAARDLGLALSRALLLRADEVIR